MKKMVSVFAALLLAAALTACGGGGSTSPSEPAGSSQSESSQNLQSAENTSETYHIVSAHASAEHLSPLNKAMKDVVNDTFDGVITMEVFWNGELASINREQLEMCRNNLIQWQTVPAFEFFTQSPNLSSFLFFDLPYVFDDYQQFYDFVDSDFAAEKLFGLTEGELGVTTTGGFHMGFVELGTVKAPISDVDSVKNMKIRTSLSEIYVDMVKAWGAAPTSLEWSECYTALQQGAIDGLTTGAGLMTSARLNEPLGHVANVDAIMFNHLMFFNTEFLNTLPDDLRQALLGVQDEVYAIGRKGHEDIEENAWKTMEETCEVHYLTAEQKATFAAPATTIWEAKADLIGREFLEEALAVVGKQMP